ncbi:MAG: SulP family inorganic anion transporter [Gammaproteobacteria bacterium]|nr:SulP family inorganic anion transporter [Gammaproteobacteria bacterium]MDH4314697.1 SulP family inorganic anion transporter [Gammaproteobacteria bacterium]MDH5214979.1 SulP family inorganic anion transporter [Gammaproteobacteria bacterium]MDH5500742.1 SulP family inorganic anion transporter [Gammaproteobacteria bacterium]
MIRHLNFSNLRNDLFGGLTAAIVALPLALAFGVASGAGPVAGLYGAICVGFFASLFGGTPSQISGPTGPMTIVAATVFTHYGSNPSQAFTIVMMAGLFQILFGYLKLGRYVNLMPYPVISGFMNGIGCILIVLQLTPLLGYPALGNVINAITVLPADFSDPNWHAVSIGLVSFGICLLLPFRVARVVPPPVLAIAAGVALVAILPGAPVIGEIPTALPTLHMPVFDFADLNQMLIFAAVIGGLGSIDSLLTSLVADNVTRDFHDSDRELTGQGIGNLVSGLLGGIPGAGATIRTLSNIRAGGRTPLSGMFHAVVLLLIALGMGPLVAYIPHAALAGILLKVGIDVIDWRFLRRMHRAPRADLVTMLIVLALTVFVDVITAVAAGMIFASLLFVKETADLQIESIRTISHADNEHLLTDEERALFQRCGGKALILHLSGLMSFGAANELVRRMSRISDYEVLIIDLLDVPKVDGSAALALEEIMQSAARAKRQVIIVGLNFAVARLLARLGILDLVQETHRVTTRHEAVSRAVSIVEARHLPVDAYSPQI